MQSDLGKLMGKCLLCLKSGDPYPTRKLTLSRIHLRFSDCIYFGEDRFPHFVDFYAGYSKVALRHSNRLNHVLQQLEKIWILRHGDPVELWADQEFNRVVVKGSAKEGASGFETFLLVGIIRQSLLRGRIAS